MDESSMAPGAGAVVATVEARRTERLAGALRGFISKETPLLTRKDDRREGRALLLVIATDFAAKPWSIVVVAAMLGFSCFLLCLCVQGGWMEGRGACSTTARVGVSMGSIKILRKTRLRSFFMHFFLRYLVVVSDISESRSGELFPRARTK